MKTVSLICFACYCCISFSTLAQKPKVIENDLLKQLNKFTYWEGKINKYQPDGSSDSTENAIYQFGLKLKYYAGRCPDSLSQILGKIGGLSSDDGLLQILSWDTYSGGTQHIFENIIGYHSGQRTKFILDTTNNQGDYVYAYDKLFSLKVERKTYYLATYYGIFDLYSRGEGIRIFSIEDGKLNDKVKLIKTKKGLTNKLYYSYSQQLTNSDILSYTTMKYDPKLKTIAFPVISKSGFETDNTIVYKFNGQYFEKVKS